MEEVQGGVSFGTIPLYCVTENGGIQIFDISSYALVEKLDITYDPVDSFNLNNPFNAVVGCEFSWMK